MGRLGRPPRAESTLRTAQVGVALTAAEAEVLAKLADARQVRPSVAARELVLCGLARLDEQDPAQAEQPTRPTAAAVVEAAQLRAEIVELGNQLARVGTNVNQISRNLHRGPAHVPEDLATQLDQVAALVAATRVLIVERTP